jgi:lipopolysaccharide assembly protein A
MYLSLVVAFLLLLALVIATVQNTMVVDIRFLFWNLQMSMSALVFYSAMVGGAIVAVLSLPALANKYLKMRKLKKKISTLEQHMAALKQENSERP